MPRNFDNLPGLNTIRLSNNNIQQVKESTFRGTPNLRYLYLDNNSITEIESGAFKNLPNLRELYLQYNHLRRIEADTFSDLQMLKRLDLKRNRLKRLPADAFFPRGDFTANFGKRNIVLHLGLNPLECDCGLAWLLHPFGGWKIRGTMRCWSPSEMRGRLLGSMSREDLHCS